MAKKVLAIVGSYRKAGTIDSAVDLILEGAAAQGAETSKIYLLDEHIEFCTNCRRCTQSAGAARGKCALHDDLESVLTRIEAADALVLGAPVNFYNVNALFRRFMERLVGYSCWPWDKPAGPVMRVKQCSKKAALVTSAAMPRLLIPFATGASRALKITAKVLGAKPIAMLSIGLSAVHEQQHLPPKVKAQARRIGQALAG